MKSLSNLVLLCTTICWAQTSLESLNPFDWNKATFDISIKPDFQFEGYKTILIAEVLNEKEEKSNHTNDLFDELTASIIESNQIEVVDRKKTELLLNEFKFQSNGLVDDKTMSKLGEFKGSGLLLVSRIQIDEYSDNITSSTASVITSNVLNVDDACDVVKTRNAKYKLSASIKIIELESSEVIYANTINAEVKDKSTGYCKEPPGIDEIGMYQKCLKKLKGETTKLFKAYNESVSLKFQKNSKFNAELKNAITYFNIGEFDTGYEILVDICEQQTKAKIKSAALYNLALIQYYQNDFDNAKKNVKDAYVLNPNNDACLKILNDLKKIDS